MDDILREFLVESNESLDRLDRDLLSLEERPDDPSTISSIFRTIHTIKGTSGFLAFKKLEGLAHVAESLLSLLRDRALSINAEITSALLSTNDAVRSMLGSIEKSGTDGEECYRELIDRLALLQGSGQKSVSKPEVTAAATPAPPAQAPVETPVTPPVVAAASSTPSGKADVACVDSAHPPAANPHPELPAENHPESGNASQGGKLAETSIRVDVELLERLMNLVGELVLARNQILQFANQFDDAGLGQTSQRLNLVTTELQEGVMKTRMQPIGNVWSKFPRVVRDLALACKKKVRIEMEGKETELDRSLLEAIKDPLTHIVRNSIDHGIELPAVRAAAGKNEEGVLRLRAYHEGGQVNIEISDDGNGIDLDRVKAKAVQQNLITAEQAAKMSDRETIALIFRPGFSTAAAVTNISGRGVGMDVVKSNIEKIGGNVEIQSRLGEGTTLRIKIPLTLAIIPALTVMCGGDRFAIPQVSLLELVRLECDDAKKGIENLHGSLVHRLRGRLLPLVFLSDELGLTAGRSPREVIESIGEFVNIVVLQAEGRPFGLVVDRIQDTEEIVVKPLGKHLKSLPAFAGTTIMGDGSVALILDVRGIATSARIIGEDVEAIENREAKTAQHNDAERRTLLLFQIGVSGRMAVPLADVSRLEEFKAADIEQAGALQVIQYRGDIMPLVEVASIVPSHSAEYNANGDDSAKEIVQAIVHTSNGRTVGLVVSRILDIVDEEVASRREATRDGVKETVVVQGKVTEVLDIRYVLDSIDSMLNHTNSMAARS